MVVVESEAIATVGVGEGTIPPILEFHHQLGTDFVGWSHPKDRFFHQFGQKRAPLNSVSSANYG